MILSYGLRGIFKNVIMPLEKLVQHSVLVPFPDVLAIYKMQIPQHIQGRYYFRKCKWTPEMIVASVYGVHIYLYPFQLL